MRSPRRAAHTSLATTLPPALRRLFLLLHLAAWLTVSAITLQAQQSSTDLSPSSETAKGAGGAGVAKAKADGAALDLAKLDVADFLRACDRNGTAIHQRLLNYTYRLKKVRREFNDQGKAVEKQSQEFEAYPVRGQHILIQLLEDGLPLPSEEITWQRRRAGERLERAEREAEQQKQAGRDATDAPDGYPAAGIYGRVRHRPVGISIDPSTILRSCDLTAPRLEALGERETVVFDFKARPGVALPPRRAYLAQLSGRVWIDAADKVIVRIAAWPTDGFRKTDTPQAATAAEPRLVYQQTRLASGAWVPTLMRLNSGGNPALFDGLNWDVVFEFTDYKQFTTSVEDFKPDAKKGADK
ncbi:MAG TPA: hypothetical protein VIS78_03650 [Blastocatellia bacterium]